MALRKYTDYISENKNMKTSTVSEPKVQEPKVQEPKVKKIKKPTVDKKNESIIFNGKIVSFNGPVKPSTTISLLESKNISKSKLFYIITEQKNSLVILKYNTEIDMKLTEFSKSLVKYHQDKLNLFENTTVEGSDSFSIIKNIDDNKQLLIENIIKLLK